MEGLINRTSYHAVYDASILDALQFAKANGFGGIQIADETPHMSFERLSTAQVDAIAEFIDTEGIYATLHAPDEAASLFQCSRYISDGIRNYFQALFSFARQIGVRMVTIHPGAMTVFTADDETGRRMPQDDVPLYASCLKQNLESILTLADGRFMICVENCGFGEAEYDLLEPYVGRDGLFLCWDLVKGTKSPEIESRYLARPEWIKQVHLHDRHVMTSGSFKGHRTIGTGDIDFAGLLGKLAQNDYVEDFCIEVRPQEKAKESLLALKQIMKKMEVVSIGESNKRRDDEAMPEV